MYGTNSRVPAGLRRPQGSSMQLQLQVAAGCVELAFLVHRAARHVHRLLHLWANRNASPPVARRRGCTDAKPSARRSRRCAIHPQARGCRNGSKRGALRWGTVGYCGMGALRRGGTGKAHWCCVDPLCRHRLRPHLKENPCRATVAAAAARTRAQQRSELARIRLRIRRISRSHERTSSARCDLRLDSTSHASAVRAVRT